MGSGFPFLLQHVPHPRGLAGSPAEGDAQFYNYDHISGTHVFNSLFCPTDN